MTEDNDDRWGVSKFLGGAIAVLTILFGLDHIIERRYTDLKELVNFRITQLERDIADVRTRLGGKFMNMEK